MSTPTEKTIMLPLVHMNGTGHRTLTEDYDAADETLENFIRTWGDIEFNSRDYYPLGDHAWTEARDARDAINQKIRDIKDYIQAHREHLYAQKK